jgi:transposase-like protein
VGLTETVICPGKGGVGMLESSAEGIRVHARSYPPEVRRQAIELARSRTRVAQLSATVGMTETRICNWLTQERIGRGEEAGKTTDQQLNLAVAKRRTKQLETELVVARKINEVFLKEGISPGSCGGSGWPASSPTSTRPRAAPTAR